MAGMLRSIVLLQTFSYLGPTCSASHEQIRDLSVSVPVLRRTGCCSKGQGEGGMAGAAAAAQLKEVRGNTEGSLLFWMAKY